MNKGDSKIVQSSACHLHTCLASLKPKARHHTIINLNWYIAGRSKTNKITTEILRAITILHKHAELRITVLLVCNSLLVYIS